MDTRNDLCMWIGCHNTFVFFLVSVFWGIISKETGGYFKVSLIYYKQLAHKYSLILTSYNGCYNRDIQTISISKFVNVFGSDHVLDTFNVQSLPIILFYQRYQLRSRTKFHFKLGFFYTL